MEPLSELIARKIVSNRVPLLILFLLMVGIVFLAQGSGLPTPAAPASTPAFVLPPQLGWLSFGLIGAALCLQVLVLDNALARGRVLPSILCAGPPRHRLGFFELLLVFAFYYAAVFAWQVSMKLVGIPLQVDSVTVLGLSMVVQLVVFLYALLVARCNGVSLAALGFDLRLLGAGVRAGWSGFFALFPAGFYVAVFATALVGALLGIPQIDHPLAEALARGASGVELAIAFTLASVAAPIFEELVFRGLLYKALRSAFSGGDDDMLDGVRVPRDPIALTFWALYRSFRWLQRPRVAPVVAMLLSSLIFASAHAGFYHYGPIFVLGMLFAWLYEKTGQLWAPMLAHCLHNTLQLGLFLTFN